MVRYSCLDEAKQNPLIYLIPFYKGIFHLTDFRKIILSIYLFCIFTSSFHFLSLLYLDRNQFNHALSSERGNILKSTLSRLGVATIVSGTILSTLAPLQSYAATSEGTVNTPILNVRSDSSTSSSIVGKLTEGTTVDVYTVNDEWAQIKFEGQKRYVSSTYLTIGSSMTTASTTSASLYVAEMNVNLRSSMSTSASIETVIPKGSLVTHLSTHGATGSWYKVQFGTYTGYVAARYFSETSPSFYASTTAVLYDSTGSGASKIATIPEGAKVTYLDSLGATGSWYKLEYGSLVGYAPARNFTATSLAPEAVTTYYAVKNVALYNSSGNGASKIATIPLGAEVKRVYVNGLSSSWYKVQYGDTVGYAAARNFSTSKPEAVVKTTYYAVRDLVLYESSASGAARLRTIQEGTKVVQVSDANLSDSWFKIEYDGVTGFAAARHFSTKAPEEVTITPYFAIRNVAMYSSSAAGATKIATIPFGAKVEQLSQSGLSSSWFKIKYDGKTGYAGSSHFSLKDPEVVVKTDYYTTRDVVLYNRSDAEKVKVAVIPFGTKVQQVSEPGLTDRFFKIEYGPITGYATADYFSKTVPSDEQYEEERQVRIYVDGNEPLNVRSTPEVTTANKVGTLSTGTIVNIKPIVGSDWALLTSGTYSGNYIHTDYVVPVTTTPPAKGKTKKVSYTSYPMTVRQMADRQVAQFAQTDAHRYDEAYLPRAWVSVNGSTGKIVKSEMTVVSGLGTALKMTASSSSSSLVTIPYGASIQYVDRYTSGSTVWYKVKYGTMTGYVTPSSVVGTANILSRPILTSHAYGQINTGETVTITGQSGTYYTISYKRPAGHNIRVFDNTWRRASVDDLLPYVDPSQIDANSRSFYQFLDLSKSAGTTATTLNKVLTSKGTLSGQGQAFVDAASMYGVNEVYLLSHAILETGHGTSLLAKGVPVDKDGNALINSSGNRIYPERPVAATVYNMYGIQATDSNPLGNGAKYAFQQKWFSPKEAIIGGAYWIGASYINHPTYKQNTLYKMRFNPSSPGTHQYATDIGWAAKQTTSIYNIYQSLDAYTLNFDVPKYQ